MKRVMTIQDLSCLGRCSITVALPILSAMGVECAVVPTAVLSTHTLFPSPVRRDLTELMLPIAQHWQREGAAFQGIYTGYLACLEQLHLVGEYLDRFAGEDTLVLLDPVMADHGKFYTGFTQEFADEMAGLCARADLILPNVTEACLLTHTPYRAEQDLPYLLGLLEKLTALGPRRAAVLTGVCLEAGKTGFLGREQATGRLLHYAHERIPARFHGTGDLFASVTLGALMRGRALSEALILAGEYTKACIRHTVACGTPARYGVAFEALLPRLMQTLDREGPPVF